MSDKTKSVENDSTPTIQSEANVRYKVIKYWDTHPDTTWKNNIETLEEAKKVVKEAKVKTNYKYDFYVFNSDGVKCT